MWCAVVVVLGWWLLFVSWAVLLVNGVGDVALVMFVLGSRLVRVCGVCCLVCRVCLRWLYGLFCVMFGVRCCGVCLADVLLFVVFACMCVGLVCVCDLLVVFRYVIVCCVVLCWCVRVVVSWCYPCDVWCCGCVSVCMPLVCMVWCWRCCMMFVCVLVNRVISMDMSTVYGLMAIATVFIMRTVMLDVCMIVLWYCGCA